MDNKRVLVGLSGGVDSSVCALLLQRQDQKTYGRGIQGTDSPSQPGGRTDPRNPQDAGK